MIGYVAVLPHVVHNVGQISSLTASTIVALVGGSSIAVIDSIVALLILHNMNSRDKGESEKTTTPERYTFSFDVM